MTDKFVAMLSSVAKKHKIEAVVKDPEQFVEWLAEQAVRPKKSENIFTHFARCALEYQRDEALRRGIGKSQNDLGAHKNELKKLNPLVKSTLLNTINTTTQGFKELIMANEARSEQQEQTWFTYLIKNCVLLDSLQTLGRSLQESGERQTIMSNQRILKPLWQENGLLQISKREKTILLRSCASIDIDLNNNDAFTLSLKELCEMLLFRIHVVHVSRNATGAMINGCEMLSDPFQRIYKMALMRQLADWCMQKLDDLVSECETFAACNQQLSADNEQQLSRHFVMSQQEIAQNIVNIPAACKQGFFNEPGEKIIVPLMHQYSKTLLLEHSNDNSAQQQRKRKRVE